MKFLYVLTFICASSAYAKDYDLRGQRLKFICSPETDMNAVCDLLGDKKVVDFTCGKTLRTRLMTKSKRLQLKNYITLNYTFYDWPYDIQVNFPVKHDFVGVDNDTTVLKSITCE